MPAVLLLLLAAARLTAQSATTGALGGVVVDASGAAIPAASIRLESADGTAHQTTTDALGEFLLTDLPPATFTVAVSAPGFDNLRLPALAIILGTTIRIAPVLPVATRFQVIQVEEIDQLPAFDSRVNSNLSPTDLEALPLDDRRFQGLAILTPLVAQDDTPPPADAAPADSDNARLTLRGLHPMHTSYRLEGLSLTRAFDGEPRGGRSIPFTLPLEGVREFQVRAAGGSTGHDAAGSINTVTRRGTATPHGSLFLALRDSGIGASNPFSYAARYNHGAPTVRAVGAQDVRQQFGGSLGGAVPATNRRVFAFLAAEGQ